MFGKRISDRSIWRWTSRSDYRSKGLINFSFLMSLAAMEGMDIGAGGDLPRDPPCPDHKP